MKTKTTRLAVAAIVISALMESEVTGIQFEDGSGDKFNYQLNGCSDWMYIDLTNKLPKT